MKAAQRRRHRVELRPQSSLLAILGDPLGVLVELATQKDDRAIEPGCTSENDWCGSAGETIEVPGLLASVTSGIAADLDGDGDLDAVSHNYGPGRWALLRNNAREPGDAGHSKVADDRRATRRDLFEVGISVDIDLDGPSDAPDFSVPDAAKLMTSMIDSRTTTFDGTPAANFGLGARAEEVWVRARWPEGRELRRRISPDQLESLVVLDR